MPLSFIDIRGWHFALPIKGSQKSLQVSNETAQFDRERKKMNVEFNAYTTLLHYSCSEIHKSGPPTGTTLLNADDLKEWRFSLTVLGESVYEGETFALRFRFNDNYPLEAPEVVFLTASPYKAPEVSHRILAK